MKKEISKIITKCRTIRTNNKTSLRMYFFVIEISHLIKFSFKWMIASRCLKKLVKRAPLKFSNLKQFSQTVKTDKKILILRILIHQKKKKNRSKQKTILMGLNFKDTILMRSNRLTEKRFQKCLKGRQYIESWTRNKQKLKA